MSRCEVRSVKKNKATEYIISGCIDESLSIFLDLFSEETNIIINLDEVTAINSTGIREWVKLMTLLKTTNIHLINCPKLFIDQVNMIKDFLPANSSIESFYVPYFSEKNNTEKEILFERNIHFTEKFVNFNSTITGNDGISYELDIIANRYFKFINHGPK